jgi:hypothetical protein
MNDASKVHLLRKPLRQQHGPLFQRCLTLGQVCLFAAHFNNDLRTRSGKALASTGPVADQSKGTSSGEESDVGEGCRVEL